MAFAILRTQKLKGASVSASDQHTERTRETLNADASKLQENIRLIGEPGDKLRDLVNREISQAGGKPRSDSVECVEFLFAASPEFFDKPTKTIEFAEKTMEYMEQLEERGFKFVKAVMHVDEKSPHVAAYAVPFDPDGKLNAKYHFGGSKWRMSEYQDEFAEVMKPLGLERGIRGSVADHQKIQRYYGQIDQYDKTVSDLEATRQREEDLGQTLAATTTLLNKQFDNRQDLELAEVAKAFLKPDRLQQTSQGLAILLAPDSAQIKAIIAPDNKAFDSDGAKISDGSSAMLLHKLSGQPIDKVLDAVGNRFDDETKKRAARAYGEELAEFRKDSDQRDFAEAEKEVKQAAEIKAAEVAELKQNVLSL